MWMAVACRLPSSSHLPQKVHGFGIWLLNVAGTCVLTSNGWFNPCLYIFPSASSPQIFQALDMGGPCRERTSFDLATMETSWRDYLLRLQEGNTYTVRVILHCYYFQGKYQNKKLYPYWLIWDRVATFTKSCLKYRL